MKYFDEYNLEKPFWTTDTKKDDRRVPSLLRRKNKIGVDPREAWNIDYAFVVWLFNVLNTYLDDASAIIDMTFYEITICGNTKKQEDWILVLIDLCKDYLKNSELGDLDSRNYFRFKAITKIFHHIGHLLWW